MKNLTLRGILLVSDLDGTLVTQKGAITERNISAIERFVSKGGRFAFATGRSVLGTEKYAAIVPLNTPSIIYNGSGIYDFKLKKMLWSQYLSRDYIDIINDVKSRFPGIGIEIHSDESVFYFNKNKYTEAHIAFQGITVTDKPIDSSSMPDGNKILFCGDNAGLNEVSDYLRSTPHKDFDYIFSSPSYFEMLPKGISKGTTAMILADMFGINHDSIMSIGDYYNDIELIKASFIGAVPLDAPDDMKLIADIVVGKCEDGAVADFIEHIEDRLG